MNGPELSERQEAFRADVARLVQAIHHHLSGQPPPDEVAALLGPVRHLADLLDTGAPAEHLREAALTAVDVYEWPNPEFASGEEGPVLDPAILAAVERLRTAIDAMDAFEGQGWLGDEPVNEADTRLRRAGHVGQAWATPGAARPR
jgi:hypothetical protein